MPIFRLNSFGAIHRTFSTTCFIYERVSPASPSRMHIACRNHPQATPGIVVVMFSYMISSVLYRTSG
jgi:hypothetical protein